ncbi:hypothetical protein Tco_0781693 [Tanacetum coccineum]
MHFLKFPENSLEVLKLLENSVEVLKILKNKLESMKILENKLESLKLQENQPVDGLVIDMPEEMLVGQYLPPYYISQLRDYIIISGSFKFVGFSIIYAWELQVNDGEVSWYRKLFTLPYPIEHDLKLIGFTKDNQPIVEASFVQQLHQSLQVFNPTFQIFQNLIVESNHGSFFIGLYKESLILLNV